MGPAAQMGPPIIQGERETTEPAFFLRASEAGEVAGSRLRPARAVLQQQAVVADWQEARVHPQVATTRLEVAYGHLAM
jgi:hypothetical protein